jgi:hypothetical protein
MIANVKRVKDWIDENGERALFADGLDDAVVGLTRDIKSGEYRVVYDINRVLNLLQNDQGMSYDDAVEHLEHNIVGAHLGDLTPVWMFLPECGEA